jgi:Family of unknown function (DUF6520)
MKKMYFVLIAVIMAISLSAFTPKANVAVQTVWFQDNDENWISQDLTPCTAGSDPVCEITTQGGYGLRRIFQSASQSNPFSKQ